MSWIKDVILDIIVVFLIASLLVISSSTLTIILWVYTGFLLLGKILYFFIDFLQLKASKSSIPYWFNQLIYAISVTLLLVDENYYLVGAWVLIWILSSIPNVKKLKPKKA